MYSPILIHQTLSYIDNSEHSIGKSFQWLGIIIIVRVFNAISFQHSFYMFRKLGYDQHSAVSVSVMKKILNVSFQSNKQYKTGEIINIMQVDLQRILQFNIAVAQVIFLPFQIGISFYLLFDFIGISFLAGLGVMILGLLTNFQLGRWGWRVQKQIMVAKDNRTKQAHEIFSQIKFIKANAVEEYFKNKLIRFREKEIQLIKKKNIVSGLFTFAFQMTPQLTLNVTLAVYIWLQNNLTPADTFTIISLFNILQQSASALPSYIIAKSGKNFCQQLLKAKKKSHLQFKLQSFIYLHLKKMLIKFPQSQQALSNTSQFSLLQSKQYWLVLNKLPRTPLELNFVIFWIKCNRNALNYLET